VIHGIARRREGGTVRISARREGAAIEIEIQNPTAANDEPATPGSRTAVKNIAQRLALVYGERAHVELGHAGEVFRARLIFPVVAAPAEDV